MEISDRLAAYTRGVGLARDGNPAAAQATFEVAVSSPLRNDELDDRVNLARARLVGQTALTGGYDAQATLDAFQRAETYARDATIWADTTWTRATSRTGNGAETTSGTLLIAQELLQKARSLAGSALIQQVFALNELDRRSAVGDAVRRAAAQRLAQHANAPTYIGQIEAALQALCDRKALEDIMPGVVLDSRDYNSTVWNDRLYWSLGMIERHHAGDLEQARRVEQDGRAAMQTSAEARARLDDEFRPQY